MLCVISFKLSLCVRNFDILPLCDFFLNIVKTVSAKAGHSRTSTTLDIYTHAVKAANELASQVLDDILTPQKNKCLNHKF